MMESGGIATQTVDDDVSTASAGGAGTRHVDPAASGAVAGAPPRERIISMLQEQPGATIRSLAKALECTPQTASYHLDILIRRGLVANRRDGRKQRHFVAGQARDPDALLGALLRDPHQAVVIRQLASMPESTWTINRLSQASGASFGVCKRVAQRLAEMGMASLERRRGRYILRPAQRLADAETDAVPEPAEAPGLVREGRIPPRLSYG